MRRLVFILVVALGCGTVGQLYAGQEMFLKRAVWSDDRVWLLSDGGQVFSVAEQDTAPRFEYPGDDVLDICVAAGQLQALVLEYDFPDYKWRLRNLKDRHWVDEVAIPVVRPKDGEPPEPPMALLCDGDGVSILTHNRLLAVHGGKVSGIALAGKLGFGLATVLATPKTLYVGYNMGEWGGGLQSIDRATGAVKRIEKTEGADRLCGGPINTACDPVNGLVPSPWHEDCIVAAIGLQHMSSHGRVVEVCDSVVRRVYFKNFDGGIFGDKGSPSSDPSIEAFSTVAFYGLAVDGKDVLAVGMDGLYHLHADGTADVESLPKLTGVAPFQLNFDRHDMVLVMTSINARTSVGGPTPILVPRN